MHIREYDLKIRDRLAALVEGTPERDEYIGVCWAVRQSDRDPNAYFDYAEDWLQCMFPQWPEYSGSDVFPVPAPDDYVCGYETPECRAASAYWKLPLWSGEYGEARLRLAKFLLAAIEEQLANQSE